MNLTHLLITISTWP